MDDNYVQIFPAGGTQPYGSTVNDVQGEVVANASAWNAGGIVSGCQSEGCKRPSWQPINWQFSMMSWFLLIRIFLVRVN